MKEKLSNEEFIEKAIQLHKLYCELYSDDLVGIGTGHIHINEERYFQLVSLEESTPSICSNNIRYSTVIGGVNFITLKSITVDMIKNKI